MPKTTAETIAVRLKESVNREYLDSLYRQARFMLGEKWNSRWNTPVSGGILPWYGDIEARYTEVGQSKRILGSAMIGLSRTVYSQPAIECPQCDPIDALVRQQLILQRASDDSFGDWSYEDQMVYLDGSQLGFGGCQIVLDDNPETGRQRIGIQHIPAWCILRDWSSRNPTRSSWRAFVHVLSKEVAEDRFGSKVLGYVKTLSTGADSRQAVRIIEYWDDGRMSGTPTCAYIPDDIENEPLEIEENPYGHLIPFAPYVHFIAPGMAHPIGRVAFEMASQEAQNQAEKYMRRVLKNPPVRIIDPQVVDESDMRRWAQEPDNPAPVRMRDDRPVMDARPPLYQHPGMDVQPGVLAYMQIQEREGNAMSGTNDNDRGNAASVKRTATESQILDARSQTQGSWDKLQTLLYQTRKMKLVLEIAKRMDKDDLWVSHEGSRAKINDPSQPALALRTFLDEPSEIKITEESLEYRDYRVERQQAIEEVAMLGKLIPPQVLDMRKWAENLVKAGGKDAEDYLLDQSAAPVPGMDPAAMQGAPQNPAMVTPGAM